MDSEDDLKDFGDIYAQFKQQFEDALADDEKSGTKSWYDSSDLQSMRLFRGVLDKDALDPGRKAYRKKKREQIEAAVQLKKIVKKQISNGLESSDNDSQRGKIKDESATKTILIQHSNVKSNGGSTSFASETSQTMLGSIALTNLNSASLSIVSPNVYDSQKRKIKYDLSGAQTLEIKGNTDRLTSPAISSKETDARASKEAFVRNSILEDLDDLQDLTEENQDYADSQTNQNQFQKLNTLKIAQRPSRQNGIDKNIYKNE